MSYEGEPVMRNSRHCLSNVDRIARTADCSVCGQNSRIKVRKTQNRCINKYNEEQNAQGKRERQRNSIGAIKARKRNLNYHRNLKAKIKDLMPPCEACGGTDKVCWDHDHKTGNFRGWLCATCNFTLGFAKDNPEILQNLITYLNRDNEIKISLEPGRGKTPSKNIIYKTLFMLGYSNGK